MITYEKVKEFNKNNKEFISKDAVYKYLSHIRITSGSVRGKDHVSICIVCDNLDTKRKLLDFRKMGYKVVKFNTMKTNILDNGNRVDIVEVKEIVEKILMGEIYLSNISELAYWSGFSKCK